MRVVAGMDLMLAAGTVTVGVIAEGERAVEGRLWKGREAMDGTMGGLGEGVRGGNVGHVRGRGAQRGIKD